MKHRRDADSASSDFHVDIRSAVARVLQGSRRAALASSAMALLLTVPDAQAQQSTATTSAPSEPALSEIVVSAQRRTESLQDVPYNISAITGDTLRDGGVVSINSLTGVVPGLMNVDQGPAARGGNNNFILRGLRTDPPGGGAGGPVFQNLTVSPVSTYFGETPVFFQMPLDDLERVEVLRGPQGTLYGSGAQAGTIRFIPKRPQFDEFSGEVSADGSYTDYAPSANGSVHAVVNIPLAEHLALRVVAGEDHLAGFIKAVDRVKTDANGVPVPSIPGDLASGFVLGPVQDGTNHSDQWFARASLRWEPTAAFDMQLDYFREHTSMADSQWGSAWPGGPFDSTFGAIPNTVVNTRAGCNHCTTNWAGEPFSDGVNLVDLTATLDVGLATVTSATSYYDDETVTNYDQTGQSYGTANPPTQSASLYIPYYPYLNYPRGYYYMRQPSGNHSFVQELRLVSTPGKKFDYVAGLYYQRQTEFSNNSQSIPGIIAYDEFIGQPNPSSYGDHNYLNFRNTEFSDKAIFGELTYHLTEDWQVTGGIRFFKQSFTSDVTILLPLCGAICAADQTNPNGLSIVNDSTNVSRHVSKLNTSYDFSPTLKVYATYSEGFRHGGVAGLPPSGPFASAPNLQTFQPDLAKNYEIGVKGSLFEHRINYFADVYLVNLYNFQFDNISLGGVIGAFNGKTARSEGLELETQAALTDSLSVGVGYAFTKAFVSKSFDILDYPAYALVPSLGGTGQLASLFGGPIPEGTRLPGVAQNVLTAMVDYSVSGGRMGGDTMKWKFHLDGAYRSSETTNLNAGSIFNYEIPSAFTANGRISLDTSDRLTYSFFVRNITNNPDITGAVDDQRFANPYRLRNVGRPRTVGLGLRYRFGKL